MQNIAKLPLNDTIAVVVSKMVDDRKQKRANRAIMI
jgi:hypothetical protein